MRPVIGIPCFAAERAGTQRPIFGSSPAYVRAIERAGGVPLLIPPLRETESLSAAYATLDGVLLAGGGDMDPTYYGESAIPECGEPDRERDEQEIAITRRALEDGLPIFGVCRGMQVLNVVQGGSLYQDLAVQRGGPSHDQTSSPWMHLAHDMSINPDSRLAGIVGATRQAVNSFHHQAVKRAGEGVEIVAWSEDGVAEAMELRGHPFALAVQYHPEEMAPQDPASQRLFDAFVAACKERMSG